MPPAIERGQIRVSKTLRFAMPQPIRPGRVRPGRGEGRLPRHGENPQGMGHTRYSSTRHRHPTGLQACWPAGLLAYCPMSGLPSCASSVCIFRNEQTRLSGGRHWPSAAASLKITAPQALHFPAPPPRSARDTPPSAIPTPHASLGSPLTFLSPHPSPASRPLSLFPSAHIPSTHFRLPRIRSVVPSVRLNGP